jgi:isocitrate dehydrogenase (NAD+)
MNLNEYAAKIEKATLDVSGNRLIKPGGIDSLYLQTIAEGKTITGDLGGKATTKEYTAAIINRLARS